MRRNILQYQRPCRNHCTTTYIYVPKNSGTSPNEHPFPNLWMSVTGNFSSTSKGYTLHTQNIICINANHYYSLHVKAVWNYSFLLCCRSKSPVTWTLDRQQQQFLQWPLLCHDPAESLFRFEQLKLVNQIPLSYTWITHRGATTATNYPH